MAVTVEEIKGTRRYGWSSNGSGTRHASLAVRVITDDPLVDGRAACFATGLNAGAYYRAPLFEAPTSVDYGCFLSSIEAQEESDDGKSWIVSLEYSSVDWQTLQGGTGSGADASAFIANPLNAPPSVRWSSEADEIVVTHDRNGKAILNSAGDPFDPPIARPFSTPVATVTRMLASFDPNWITTYKDRVNASEWLGFPANTVLCKDISADRVYDADWGWMWSQTLQFAFRPIIFASDGVTLISAGWSALILSAGMRRIDPSGKLVAKFSNGEPINSPIPLDEDGHYFSSSGADPYFMVFDILEETDFSGFDLPPDLFSVTAGTSPAGGS